MFRHIHEHRAVWSLLRGLIVVALCSNSVTWALCPHVSGSPSHCAEQQSVTHSHRNIEDTGLEHMHSAVMQMSDMDMQRMDTEDASPPVSNGIVDAESSNLAPVNSPMVALPESGTSCSHCFMHSRSDASSSSRTATLNSPSHESIGSDSSADIVTPSPWLITVVEIHDHGPPGSNNSRYILNSTYRI
jgi:hypothetical protein